VKGAYPPGPQGPHRPSATLTPGLTPVSGGVMGRDGRSRNHQGGAPWKPAKSGEGSEPNPAAGLPSPIPLASRVASVQERR